jgi:uncharacterized protein YfaS (alpha-2-macroglobulin family)
LLKYTKKIKTILAILLFTSFTLSINSCINTKIKDDTIFTEEVAKTISHVSNGVLPPNAEIIVRFVNPIIDKNQIGQEIDIISFSPSINGKTVWKDERTLSFKPEIDMNLNTEYHASVDINNILKDNIGLKKFYFSFKTLKREISDFNSDFRLVSQNNPEKIYYQGDLSLNTETNIDILRNSLKLKIDEAEIPIQIFETENKNKFTFKSNEIKRINTSQLISFSINKDSLGLNEDFVKNDTLESIETMKVTKIDSIEQEKDLGLLINFTDHISNEQDINGFIKVEPSIDIKVRQEDNKIRVSGNFQYGKKYTLKIEEGIKSKWGTSLKDFYSKEISFDDIKPQASFSNDGVFLTSSASQKIYFKTVNLSNVRIVVKKVFESNTGIFLQTERLSSPKNRTDIFDSYSVERVGINVVEKDLPIGDKKNKWLQHEIDLNKIINPKEKGLFLVTLFFEKKDMLYNFSSDKNQTFDGDDYYNNPNSDGYISSFGSIHKALILSDIGITYKKGYKQHIIYITDIITAKPKDGVSVSLKNYQNQIISTKETNSEGQVIFNDIEQEVFYVEAEKDLQKSVVLPNEMSWNLSTFDTDGDETQDDGTKAFIYTERGVYRPSETVNISVIARNSEGTFPDNYPLNLKIYNPKQQVVFEQTQKDSKEGFYHFKFDTNENDMTGNWTIEANTGNKTFSQLLKIETVIPNRLKIKLENDKNELSYLDKSLNFKVKSNYLFGNPASNLESEVQVALSSINKTFKNFPDYTFSNEGIDFKSFNEKVSSGLLNNDGEKKIEWNLPDLSKAPSQIKAVIDTKVIEKGGRDTQNKNIVLINPFESYVGIQKPQDNYFKTGDEIKFKTVLLNNKGKNISDRKLKYTIYQNNRNWWWEYDNQNDFRLHYKSDNETKVVKQLERDSKNSPDEINFKPETNGEYFLEVKDVSNPKGHTAGIFFSTSFWANGNAKDDGVLVLRADKEKYNIGDKAIINFPNPENSECLISLERGNKVLKSYWYSSKEKNAKIEIDITSEMLPTTYLSVSVIQKHSQTENDRPIRMYGVIPLNIEDKNTRQGINIKVANEIKSKKSFDVEIQTTDNKPTQYTIAVVDDGLLDLTNFKTPDPWYAFYKKLRLGVSTHDLFAYVIGVNKGDIFKTFSIGGDLDYRVSQQEMNKAKRFKLVSMFKSPAMTDSNGYAKVSFDMPEYLGSVRVMVMSANGNRFGSAEKSVKVKSDLIVLPTIPRVLSPNDSISIPVSVFSTKDNIKNVDIKIETEGGLIVRGESKKSLFFEKSGDKDIYFNIDTENISGKGKITLIASSGKIIEKSTTEINIRPASPRIRETEQKISSKGNNVKFIINNKGIKDSNKSILTISRKQKLNLNNRLDYLISYPYGCLEQITSSVFPQLFLKDFINTSSNGDKKIDANINLAIKNLRKFQLGNGSFTYWNGEPETNIWGTNYAGHFLIEAQKKGYYIPDEMLSNWFKYQKNQSLSTLDSLTSRVYRTYLLALGGQPEFGSMNLLKENEIKKMNDTQKWLLAGAYKLSGMDSVATQIIGLSGFNVNEYKNEMSDTYGSGLRDKSIILEILTLFKNPKANDLYNEITESLSQDIWYSTQTTGYALMALGKYIENNSSDFQGKNLSGYVVLPNGVKENFKTNKSQINIEIPKGFDGYSFNVFLDSNTDVNNVYLSLDSSYIPIKPVMENSSKNLILETNYFDENGKNIDITKLKQGITFWAHFSVKNTSGIDLSELSLSQVLPSGWEIENTRLTDDDIPNWMLNYRTNLEEYLDIRDDRVMWFFDINANEKPYDFFVKLTAVSKGKYTLPTTLVETMYSKNYFAKKSGKIVEVIN